MKEGITNETIIEKLSLTAKEFEDWRKELGEPELSIENYQINDLNILNHSNLRWINFCDVKFIDCTISNSSFAKVSFKNVSFGSCTFINVTFDRVEFQKLDLMNSKGKGLAFEGCSLENSRIFTDTIESKTYSRCHFIDIDLSSKNASELDFSEITFDEKSKRHAVKNKDFTIGLNGIYNRTNLSASVTLSVPSGDSMSGASEDVIVESLQKAKKNISTSISVTLVVFVLKYIGIGSFAFFGLNLNPFAFGLIAIPVILVALYKGNVLLGDVITNIKYVNTQTGAMKIGRYPWLISRFGGNSSIQKIESLVVRLLYCGHVLLLVPMLYEVSTGENLSKIINSLNVSEDLCRSYQSYIHIILITICGLFVFVVYFSIRLFIKSQKLQKPLLFNLKLKYRNQKPDQERIADSIEELNKNLENYYKSKDPFYNSNFGFSNRFKNQQ